jgi:hypothetical protein
MIQADSGHFLASPYGGAFAVGNDDEDVWGGLTGTEIGEAFGVGGLGMGGGTGDGTIGLGDYGTIGKGSGSGYGRGSGAGFGGRGTPRRTRKGAGHLGASMHADFVGLGLVSQIEEATKLAEKSAALAEAHAIPDEPEAEPAAKSRPKRRAPTGLRSNASRFVGRGVPLVRQSLPKTTGPLDRDVVRRIVRAHLNEIRFCYNQGLALDLAEGEVAAAFEIDAGGHVRATKASSSDLAPRTTRCIERAVERWRFPGAAATTRVDMSWSMRALSPMGRLKRPRPGRAPHEGGYAAVQAALHSGAIPDAVELAELWVAEQPGDVVALLGLGEALETDGQRDLAARVYGSIIDLHPDRADLRRVAGERLHRLGDALPLAIDTFEKALAQRPDHQGSYRLLAMSLLQSGAFARAFAALEDGLRANAPFGRFAGSRGLLAADLELVGAIWATKDPARASAIDVRLEGLGLARDAGPSARAVVHWETDASDVDLHVTASDGPAPSVRADVVDGYGPEWTLVRDALPASLRIRLHHYARGPVGYAGGTVHVLTHDGAGSFDLTTQPFLLMTDRGLLDLGTFEV